MNLTLPGTMLLLALYGMPAILQRNFEGTAMSPYLLWMTIGTVVIFALYGLRCLLTRRGTPVRKWALLTALIALVLTVRLALEFARVGYVVLMEALDYENVYLDVMEEWIDADEAKLTILENLFTFNLSGLSFFCGAVGVCLSVLLANRLTRKGAVWAGMDAFAPFGALLVVLFRVGQISEPLSGGGKLLPDGSSLAHFPFALGITNERGVTTWVWAICLLSAAIALVWAVIAFIISLRNQGRPGLTFTLTLFFLCVPQIMCESMRDNDIRWLFVHAEQLFCAVVAFGVLLFWVIGTRGITAVRRWAPLAIMVACLGLLVVTEFAIDGKWFDFSHTVCYIFMTLVLAVMGFAGVWAARNWNRSGEKPAEAAAE